MFFSFRLTNSPYSTPSSSLAPHFLLSSFLVLISPFLSFFSYPFHVKDLFCTSFCFTNSSYFDSIFINQSAFSLLFFPLFVSQFPFFSFLFFPTPSPLRLVPNPYSAPYLSFLFCLSHKLIPFSIHLHQSVFFFFFPPSLFMLSSCSWSSFPLLLLLPQD